MIPLALLCAGVRTTLPEGSALATPISNQSATGIGVGVGAGEVVGSGVAVG